MSVNPAAGLPQARPAELADAGARPHFMRRLVRRPVALICLIYLTLVVLVAIFAPIVLPHVAGQQAGNLLDVRGQPSGAHLLGTDTLGRDVLERLLVGTRITMVAVVEAVAVAILLGVPVGLAGGYLGGRTDQVVAWVTDFGLAFPGLIVVLVVVTVFPYNTLAAMIAIGALTAPGITRIVRAATLPIRDELYVVAARVSGFSKAYIISRHVLPRIAGIVIVQAALLAAAVVIAQAGLAYLDVLNGPPAPSWGGMISDGTTVLVLDPWLIWPPGLAVILTALAFILLGDALRDESVETWAASAPGRRRSRRLPRGVRSAGRGAEQRAAEATRRERPLLSLEHVTVAFGSGDGLTPVVEDVTFEVDEGETVGLVGESGCGKTITAMSVLGLLPGTASITAGSVWFAGQDLAQTTESGYTRVRGRQIGIISQDPMVSLTPTLRVGWQVSEAVRRHHGVSQREARRRTLDLLAQVQLPDPETVARRYVHELSGGMAQRVAIARALAGEPRLLIADEPTTALDVTVQAEILDVMRTIQRDRGMAILLITHDWGVIADIAERVVLMYAGQVAEQAEINDIFHHPLHPYTQALLASNPQHAPGAETLPTIPGTVPKPGNWPTGCHFHPRCAYATGECRQGPIPLEQPAPARQTRCIHYQDLLAGAPADRYTAT